MTRRQDPNILLPLAALLAIALAWWWSSPATAAGTGLVAMIALLVIGLARSSDLGRMTRALRRIVGGDRGASMPLRVHGGLAAMNRAAQDLASALSGTREALASERLRRRILEEALREGLVILDGEASPVGGMGIAKQLKDEITDCPPVLVLTGRADDAWLANWSRAEAAVPHPIDPIRLGEAVVGLLRR